MADSDSEIEIISLDSPNENHRPHDDRRRPMHRLSGNGGLAAGRNERSRRVRPRHISSQRGEHDGAQVPRHIRIQSGILNDEPTQAPRSHPQNASVIDLTEEPDSPPQPALPITLPRIQPQTTANDMTSRWNVGFLDFVINTNPSTDQSRNPRRQMSGISRTPSLSRSDPSVHNGRGRHAPTPQLVDLVDLTDDTIGSNERPIDLRATGPSQSRRPAVRQVRAEPEANSPLSWFQAPRVGGVWRQFRDMTAAVAGGVYSSTSTDAAGGRRRGGAGASSFSRETTADRLRLDQNMVLDHLMSLNPARDVLIQLEYGPSVPADFWDEHSPDRPKPAYVPPPDVPAGFSRDTGEDIVAICPGCDEELVYDPDEVRDEQEPPAKKAKTKRDRAEHHFMAVKACGHVFCRHCYDNRKPAKATKSRSPPKSNFRTQPGNGTKLLCAVEGCDSEVGAKTAWLGIFV